MPVLVVAMLIRGDDIAFVSKQMTGHAGDDAALIEARYEENSFFAWHLATLAKL
jgi:hypothetical protein